MAGTTNRQNQALIKKKLFLRWQLMLYDIFLLIIAEVLFLVLLPGDIGIDGTGIVIQAALACVCMLGGRIIGKVYPLVWRYGGIQSYMRLLISDVASMAFYYVLERNLPIQHLPYDRIVAIVSATLLGSLMLRMTYRYAYMFGNNTTPFGKILRWMLRIATGNSVSCAGENRFSADERCQMRIAIVGAGMIGVSLAQELINTSSHDYLPVCFVDTNQRKEGRRILDIPVLSEDETILERLLDLRVQEVVFAIKDMPEDRRAHLYEQYRRAGFRVMVYDYPTMHSMNSKRQLREFDIEELLFRKPIVLENEHDKAYYGGKTILVTGGGGSIGSEMCRQLAKLAPKAIIALDIYENGVYDVQQELRLAYGDTLEFHVAIASITNKEALDRVFNQYKPDIVIHAAAHKHVPLMEMNCVEAVQNNVFGTKNLVDLCEQYATPRFMMVSTDKAVNPTNVMGATKRLCEMIVQSAATHNKTVYSATRFGNVLGSAGSVIPLFKRQIANGGPVTITDKRIIRYFMTIPEAAQLVLKSCIMAKKGELFVLDMGQPVRILDLAESMIRLSGAHGIEIVETGLRPGEKLYEELLVKTEELDKTDNNLIYIERDEPLEWAEIVNKLHVLQTACNTGNDDLVREALHQVVATYHTPEEVNIEAEKSQEMSSARQAVCM